MPRSWPRLLVATVTAALPATTGCGALLGLDDPSAAPGLADAAVDGAGNPNAPDAAVDAITCTPGAGGGLGIPMPSPSKDPPDLQQCLVNAEGTLAVSSTEDALAAPGAFRATAPDHRVDFAMLLKRGGLRSSFGWAWVDELRVAVTDPSKLHIVAGCEVATTLCEVSPAITVDFSEFPNRPFALWVRGCGDGGSAVRTFTSLPAASPGSGVQMVSYRSEAYPGRVYAAFEDLPQLQSDQDYANIVISLSAVEYACEMP